MIKVTITRGRKGARFQWDPAKGTLPQPGHKQTSADAAEVQTTDWKTVKKMREGPATEKHPTLKEADKIGAVDAKCVPGETLCYVGKYQTSGGGGSPGRSGVMGMTSPAVHITDPQTGTVTESQGEEAAGTWPLFC